MPGTYIDMGIRTPSKLQQKRLKKVLTVVLRLFLVLLLVPTLRRKNKAIVILETGRSASIDSAVIISLQSKQGNIN